MQANTGPVLLTQGEPGTPQYIYNYWETYMLMCQFGTTVKREKKKEKKRKNFNSKTEHLGKDKSVSDHSDQASGGRVI